MSKKILASILAAASILSLSATAFADGGAETPAPDPNKQTIVGNLDVKDTTYDVNAAVSYGTVDVTLPSKTMMAKGSVVVNPYGAAITTTIGTSNKVSNTNFIASPVYTISNNDTENGLKVVATVSVKKATGLVIVDPGATKPDGWDTAVDKNGDPVDRSGEKDAAGTALGGWNALVTYDKIAAKADKDDKTKITYTGGAMSAKQANNTAVYLVGGTAAADVAKGTGTGLTKVNFLPKGTNGGTLVEIGAGATGTPKDGYFTVAGEFNPTIDKEKYEWGKETLDLSIVLKVIPVPTTP